MKAVADALQVARSHLHEKVRQLARPRGPYRKPDDGDLLPLIRRLVDERPTYGYRRITALANREVVKAGKPIANHKRIFRIMRQNGMLLTRHTGRRKGRLHDGKVVVMRSNLVSTRLARPETLRRPSISSLASRPFKARNRTASLKASSKRSSGTMFA